MQNLPLQIYCRFHLNLFNLKFISKRAKSLLCWTGWWNLQIIKFRQNFINFIKFFGSFLGSFPLFRCAEHSFTIISFEVVNTSENSIEIFAATTWKPAARTSVHFSPTTQIDAVACWYLEILYAHAYPQISWINLNVSKSIKYIVGWLISLLARSHFDYRRI